MNQPLAIERAQVGRVMYFPALDWDTVAYSPMAVTSRPNTQANSQSGGVNNLGCEEAVMLKSNLKSQLSLPTPKKRRLHLKVCESVHQAILSSASKL